MIKRLRETGALFFCKAVYQFSDGGFFFILHKPNMLGPEEKSGLVIRSIAGKTDIYLNGVCINDKCLSCEVKIEGPYRPKATISLLCERIEMDIGKNVEVKKVNRSESQGC